MHTLSICVCVFVFQRVVMTQTLAAGTVLTCGWFYFTMFLPEGDIRLSQLGLTCSVVTVSMYLSPLTDLVQLTCITDGHDIQTAKPNQLTPFTGFKLGSFKQLIS